MGDDIGRLAAEVPEAMREMFGVAQKRVENYFSQTIQDKSSGIWRLAGNRHVLLRGDALAMEFFHSVRSIYGDSAQATEIGSALLFDLAHAAGVADARKFHSAMNLADPIDRLAVGPIYFAFAGFARVCIHENSRPIPGDEYALFYRHENSFEAESWIANKEKSESPACIISAGYSSGWCSESFNTPLVAVEHECEAMGGAGCEFVMAPPHMIESLLPKLPQKRRERLYVPRFFGSREHEEQLRRLAYQDGLTGLANRTMFQELCNQLVHMAARHKTPVGMLYLDLDGFKPVNDAHGHAAGDATLVEVAKRLKSRLRESDIACRIGGDEFVTLIVDPQKSEDLVVAANDLIREINVPISFDGKTIHVGASIGCVFVNPGLNSFDAILSAADRAMYQAKAAGKNRAQLTIL
jgi:diguanylate cyclase (GGDEF)-like protein